jgi:hypothetical protein
MNKFEDELRNGNFLVSECSNCNQVVWPPSEFCNICHNKTKWRASKQTGKIIEFSKKNDEYFCLIEIEEKLRVLGMVTGDKIPIVNQTVKIVNCSFDKTPKFHFQLISN